MTNEKFERIIEIHNRLEHLDYVKKLLFGEDNTQLAYVKMDSINDATWSVGWGTANDHISDILKRHDEEIRKEIDEEISKLKKEIKKL